MSNVLIGIIGVILFIGLAVASASYLGARFQQSKDMSKSANLMASLDQIANAVKYRKASVGTSGPAGSINYLGNEGYLSTLPPNLLDQYTPYQLTSATGTFTGSASYVVARMKIADISHMNVCKQLNRMVGTGASDGTPPNASAPPGRAGCFISDGWYQANTLVAFRKL